MRTFAFLGGDVMLAVAFEYPSGPEPRHRLYRTDEGGATWAEVEPFLKPDDPDERFQHVVAIEAEPGTLLAAGAYGVWGEGRTTSTSPSS